MIESLTIEGLNGESKPITLDFYDDINIITGRNGSGKTTILKLMWFCVSGNIERAIEEINFTKILLSTNKYNLIIDRGNRKQKEVIHLVISDSSGELFNKKEPRHRGVVVDQANRLITQLLKKSIFFPTFRRIEGGFSMTRSSHDYTRRIVRQHDGHEIIIREPSAMYSSDIQEALESHANRLSVGQHKFVSSISTIDIQKLVTRRHSDATTKADNQSKELSEKIFRKIKTYRDSSVTGKEALNSALSTLDKINQDVISFESSREEAFKSLSVLSDIIVKIFEHKGIKLNPRVTLGDIDNSINSEQLSAGEKQMLSFLCYNALFNDCPFFIDEPELSLHVDWQRILLDTMVDQGTNNQLFIATHSPFIYSLYPEKEIMIGMDRGNKIES